MRYKVYVMHPENRRRDLGLPLVVESKLFAEVSLRDDKPSAFFYGVSTGDKSSYKTKSSFLNAVKEVANNVSPLDVDYFEQRLTNFAGKNGLDIAVLGPVGGKFRTLRSRPEVDGYVGQLRVIKPKLKKKSTKLLTFNLDSSDQDNPTEIQAALSWFQVL